MSGVVNPPGWPPGTPPGVPPLPPLLTPIQAAVLLDQVVYEQVLECVDLDALYRVAQSLDTMIGEIDGIADDQVGELARSMLDRALLRLPDDLRAYLRVSEWTARENCVLCQAEARQRRSGNGAVTATGGHHRPPRPNS
jgi:hypothetical protein